MWIIKIKRPVTWQERSCFENITQHFMEGSELHPVFLSVKEPRLRPRIRRIIDIYGRLVATLKKRRDPK